MDNERSNHDFGVNQTTNGEFFTQIRRLEANDPTLLCIRLGDEDLLDPLMEALRENTTLERLDVHCVSIPFVGAFAEAILKGRNLKTLNMNFCQFLPQGSAAFFRYISCPNSSLLHLDLANSRGLFENGFAASALRTRLPIMTRLKSLNLRSLGLNGSDVCAIFDGMEQNSALECLDISDNPKIGRQLVASLIRSLPIMNGLQILTVESTGISEALDQRMDLMEALSNAMKENHKLWKLDHITLHRVEFFPDQRTRHIQEKCLKYLKQLEFFKIRNAVLNLRWLARDQPAILPHILANINRSDEFFAELAFFMLEEKCSYLSRASDPVTRKEIPSNTSVMHRGRSMDTQKKPRQPLHLRHSSGFICPLHGYSQFLPQSCCTFERLHPLRISNE